MNAAASPATTTTTSAATATKKTSKVRGPKTSSGSITLGDLAERYVKHLQTAGKSAGTVFSYSMELNLALGELGAETDLASLTPAQVEKYFQSAAVTKTKKGRAKAKPTVDKTRRVLRLALAWAAEKKLIATAPLLAADKPTAELA